MIKYLKKFLPFAALIALILVILGFASGFDEVMTFAWICFAVFFVLNIITYYFAMQTITKKFSSFMSVFFISIFSKLIITAIIVIVYRAGHEARDVNYIIPFAIVYFSFLFFETIELVSLSRRTEKQKPEKQKTPDNK
ncbi:MAG: hypothetical protein R2794_11010 [Chitinophagales bacterium]